MRTDPIKDLALAMVDPVVADKGDAVYRAAREAIAVKILRAGGLFQANQSIAIGPQLVEHRQQRAVRLEADRVGPVAGNPTFELGRARANHSLHATAASGPGDSRQVHIGTHRGTDDQQFPRPGQLARRFVPLVRNHQADCRLLSE